jgi:hypothetical protein
LLFSCRLLWFPPSLGVPFRPPRSSLPTQRVTHHHRHHHRRLMS